MDKKIIIAIISLLIVVGVVTFLMIENSIPEKTTISLYDDNEQNSIAHIINNYKDYPNVDNETIKWLKSLDNSYVALNMLSGGYVIMKRDEANKITYEEDPSVNSQVIIKGYVKKSYILSDSLIEVSLIEDVEFVNRTAIYH